MIRPLGAAALAILTVSACAPIDSMIERFFPFEETAASRAPDAAPESVQELAQAKVPPMPRRKPEAISELTLVDADPQRVVGLDFDATKALLGDPAAKMEQPPAKVWAYAGGGCMFSVFFYPSVNDQTFRVLAYEVTDKVDILDLRWLGDPPDATPHATPKAPPEAPPEAPRVLDKDDPVVRRCFAELLHQHEPNAG